MKSEKMSDKFFFFFVILSCKFPNCARKSQGSNNDCKFKNLIY